MNASFQKIAALIAWMGAFSSAAFAAATADYRIVARYPIGDPGSHDYLRVDSTARRLPGTFEAIVVGLNRPRLHS